MIALRMYFPSKSSPKYLFFVVQTSVPSTQPICFEFLSNRFDCQMKPKYSPFNLYMDCVIILNPLIFDAEVLESFVSDFFQK